MNTHVTETPAASSDVALRHFEEMLAFETDCWDVELGVTAVGHRLKLPDAIAVLRTDAAP